MAGVLFLLLTHLLHFAQFVDWPDQALRAGAPIIIGIVGQDPFGHTIDDMAATSHANGHSFIVRRLQWNDTLTNCNILFITFSETEHIDAILAATHGASVLTVASAPRFAARGGVIELFPAPDGFDFDVNTQAAAEAHLKISSKLLHVARAIRRTVK